LTTKNKKKKKEDMKGIFILLIGLLFACNTSDKILSKVFDERELITVNQIIDFYDNFVQKNTGDSLQIDKAYLKFLSINCPVATKTLQLTTLLPSSTEELNFYSKLDKETLKEIFIISDSVNGYSRKEKKQISVYQPFTFKLNTKGQYYKLLKILSERNEFYKNYFNSLNCVGDLGIKNYTAILTKYRDIDFSKKEERLVLIVNLLHMKEGVNFDER